MTVTMSSLRAVGHAITTFTFRLHGEHWRDREPVPGDLIVFYAERPGDVVGPPGWTKVEGYPAFWKIISPRENDPVFRSMGAGEWNVQAFCAEPVSSEGSAAEALDEALGGDG